MAHLHGVDFARRFVRRIGADNVIYGSDWFGPNGEMERQLGYIERMGLTREERSKILWENVRRVMGYE